jgi:hypothetical protein
MQVSLIQHPFQLQGCLHPDQRSIQPGNLAHQLVSRQDYFDVVSMRRMEQSLGKSPLQPFTFLVGSVRGCKVRAKHEKEAK